ncbi:uncharacterized protein HD556DRAFT_1440684 [Suillus plorans]|uniref:Uncharacterized protein n=1 Tax=Suillus plorans TaxID=116603 RepID=A0A9P7DLF0_9AGAM|nr:uncharacterized protein HD556DRAFT_1440684 [Suillus plorans]KAG1797722.1 hypothetical protein HD556DRAFT_1440684 [Suillus plorans]
MCNGDITHWPVIAPHVFWANRVTTRRSTNHSPFFLAHGLEPLLPFDITEATFMLPAVSSIISTSDLISLHARQLEKQDEDLALAHKRLLKSQLASVKDFQHRFSKTIQDYAFKPGDLILVLNKKIEAVSNAKCKPRYFRPMVVVSQSEAARAKAAAAQANTEIRKLQGDVIPSMQRQAAAQLWRLTEEDTAQVAALRKQADSSAGEVPHLRAELVQTRKKVHALQMHVHRASCALARVGAYTAQFHALARRLILAGCAQKSVGPIIQAMLKALHISLGSCCMSA